MPAEDAARPRRPWRVRLRRWLERRTLELFEERVRAPARRRRNADRSFRPLFVTGLMGSGTTLVALSLAQRFECAAAITESAHQVSPDTVLHLPLPNTFPSVAAYLEAVRPRAEWSREAVREALLDLYRSKARGRSEVVVDKGPNTTLARASLLASCFPDAGFLLVFRDPVANVEGLRRKWRLFAGEPLSSSVAFHERLHGWFLDSLPLLGPRVAFIEYETLLERYDETLAAIGRFFRLGPASRRRRLAGRPNVPGQGIRNVRAGRIRLVRDANRLAYRNLEPSEVDWVRARLGPLHEKLRSLRRHQAEGPPAAALPAAADLRGTTR
ncbi:MAG: sulfotransferase [Thermoanaerobaculia bacterium]